MPAPRRIKATKRPELLDEGDSVEFGLTSAIKLNGDDHWPHVGVISTVRPGESGQDAMARIKDFVIDNLIQAIGEIQSS